VVLGGHLAVCNAPCRRTSTHFAATTDIDGVGYVVSEISPYEADLGWNTASRRRD
jgi:hypothetical protein